MFRNYSKLITSYKIDEVHFRLLGTNGFHVKAKNERFTAAVRVVDRTSNMKIHVVNCLADYLKKRAVRAARLFFRIQPY